MEVPMMKLSHIVIMTVVAFALVFAGCDSTGAGGGGGGDNNNEALFLHLTELSLSATVTHTFDPEADGGPVWAADFNYEDYTDRYYALIHEEEEPDPPTFLDRDPDSTSATSNSFSLSTGVPDDEDMGTATDWGFSSSPAGVKLYAANVGMGDGTEDGDQIAEGNFDVGSNGYAKYYDYIYAAQDCTLSGTEDDGDVGDADYKKWTFNDVELSAGWNAIVTRTSDGDIFDYDGGTIDGAQWTLME
jgi:predicted small secreted protein